MGGRKGGGAKVSDRPPPWKLKNLFGKLFFSPYGCFFFFNGTFSPWGGVSFWGPYGGGRFLGMPPSPIQIFLWAPMCAGKTTWNAISNNTSQHRDICHSLITCKLAEFMNFTISRMVNNMVMSIWQN